MLLQRTTPCLLEETFVLANVRVADWGRRFVAFTLAKHCKWVGAGTLLHRSFVCCPTISGGHRNVAAPDLQSNFAARARSYKSWFQNIKQNLVFETLVML